MRSWQKLLALSGVFSLTGCPYTEGCEAGVANNAEGGVTDGSPVDGGGGDDAQEEDASIPLGPTEPGCVGLTAQCDGQSCCEADNVPGGTFNRINNPAFPATVSAFRLDRFEVVVGRFRAFVNAGFGTKKRPPAEGAGAHPNIPGSGWKAEFNALLTDSKEDFVGAIQCDQSLYDAYSEIPGKNDTLPMNCVTVYEAMAFCIWDGGRLPTETEWNYAAAGGNEQRVYPWGGTTIDKTYLNFGCQSGDSIADPGAPPCTFKDYTPVGRHPAGKGKWGHHDLAGNVWERTWDFFADPFRITPCNDCADLTPTTAGRGIRGGSLNWGKDFQRTNDRSGVNSEPLETRTNTVGFRCARPVK
jgi:formylglycine-generating enzyme required for sulfatase activity